MLAPFHPQGVCARKKTNLQNPALRLFWPSELHAENNARSSFCSAASRQGLCWRAWPCSKCSGGVTAISQLFGSVTASADIPNATPEEVAINQVDVLKKWIASCEHAVQSEISFPKVAEGSEHIVFLDAVNATVFKATRPNIYGESYFLDAAGKINQKNCSPLEYLIRLRLWKKLFAGAPRDLGITEQGQIVSVQKFITARNPAHPIPTQAAVDSFLIEAGLSAVKQQFWLWKRSYPEFEIWLGDARDDNFVATEAGIVPIDIRLWFSGHTPSTESPEW
jgi:hypothetical protein